MASIPTDTPSVGDPFARLENSLINDYLRALGHDPDVLRARGDGEARHLLAQAAVYAATRLTEVESRAHYVHEIHAGH